MRAFTKARNSTTADEIWLLEHEPVYTMGRAAADDHVLNAGLIPVVRCDRGGQVTYHGPGQIMAYCLVDLRRHKLFVKEYVNLLEAVLIQQLQGLGLQPERIKGAPGVYVPIGSSIANEPAPLAKIAALGIKVSNGYAYHGLALNVNMDLSPFNGINPCGYSNMATTDLQSVGVSLTIKQAGDMLAQNLAAGIIGYKSS